MRKFFTICVATLLLITALVITGLAVPISALADNAQDAPPPKPTGPANVLAIIESNGAWLHETNIPKLMFYADPGAFGGPEVAAYFAKNLKNIETNYVGPGTHYIQEDHPHEIGRELADWLRRQRLAVNH